MSITTYAQNFEDVMLWRALQHVEVGFYIDVGANDPEIDSVTKLFYDHGWRGINIEPVGQWYEKLKQERPRDINLGIAAGAEEGEISFYEIPDTGLSTAVRDIALDHETNHGYAGVERKVAVRRLTDICAELHSAPVHFLKIDVEGAEKSVLLGLDLSLVKPWIIVIESTLPFTQKESFAEWESIILAAGYAFVYFDGLNRFYLSDEHEELKEYFRCPPNVFDGFSFSGLATNSFCVIQNEKIVTAEALAETAVQRATQAEARAQAAEAHATCLQSELTLAKAKIDELNHLSHHWWTLADEANRARETLYASRSWRITRPLRELGLFARQIGVSLPLRLVRKFINPILLMAMRAVLHRPQLAQQLSTWLRHFPAFRGYLMTLAHRAGVMANVDSVGNAVMQNEYLELTSATIKDQELDISHLSKNARSVYFKLNTLIQHNSGRER
ncbi:FkbM family methyltransferase [Nitrincola sp.]|uniref:FkbM family methyltransferase n=1 Tax=Nitrincola sp. TaxID=1926584 RepID=UPI003A8DA12D